MPSTPNNRQKWIKLINNDSFSHPIAVLFTSHIRSISLYSTIVERDAEIKIEFLPCAGGEQAVRNRVPHLFLGHFLRSLAGLLQMAPLMLTLEMDHWLVDEWNKPYNEKILKFCLYFNYLCPCITSQSNVSTSIRKLATKTLTSSRDGIQRIHLPQTFPLRALKRRSPTNKTLWSLTLRVIYPGDLLTDTCQ